MALVLIKEDGTGLANANSYASVADGDAYYDGHLYATAWTTATADNKAKALVMATRVIDASYEFNGSKTTVAQALEWPRYKCPDRDIADSSGSAGFLASNVVPKGVSDATCEMARELLLMDRTAAPAGEGLDTVASGSGVSTTYSKTDTRPMISHLAQAMLSKFGSMGVGGSGQVRLVRV
ncbi:MAG: DnaT-like ssDNA-binding protein [Limisphaerales bacterium]